MKGGMPKANKKFNLFYKFTIFYQKAYHYTILAKLILISYAYISGFWNIQSMIINISVGIVRNYNTGNMQLYLDRMNEEIGFLQNK
jgi:hypothetical protein